MTEWFEKYKDVFLWNPSVNLTRGAKFPKHWMLSAGSAGTRSTCPGVFTHWAWLDLWGLSGASLAFPLTLCQLCFTCPSWKSFTFILLIGTCGHIVLSRDRPEQTSNQWGRAKISEQANRRKPVELSDKEWLNESERTFSPNFQFLKMVNVAFKSFVWATSEQTWVVLPSVESDRE